MSLKRNSSAFKELQNSSYHLPLKAVEQGGTLLFGFNGQFEAVPLSITKKLILIIYGKCFSSLYSFFSSSFFTLAKMETKLDTYRNQRKPPEESLNLVINISLIHNGYNDYVQPKRHCLH